jgi:hypothetical protein
VELTNWQQLCDRGPDLVLCLDFAGGRAVAGFAALAAAIPADSCFLHIRQTCFDSAPDSLDTRVDRWVREVRETGRPVRAVLGYCAGTSLATCVADAVAAAGPDSPTVVLFDATAVTGAGLFDQFTSALAASAEHLTTGELDGARRWAAHLLEAYPDDLSRVAAELADRYDQLMVVLAQRLSLNDFFRQELTRGFTAYLAYLHTASQGRLDLHTGTPLLVSSKDYVPPVNGARNISFDVGRADLLRDAEVVKLVADVLRGEHPW